MVDDLLDPSIFRTPLIEGWKKKEGRKEEEKREKRDKEENEKREGK